MKRIITLFFIIGLHQFVNAQCANSKISYNQTAKPSYHSEIDLGDNSHPCGGTFQFIISKNATAKEIFTTEILSFIESKREQNDDVLISLSPNTKVWILSKNMISDPSFKPLTTLYKLED